MMALTLPRASARVQALRLGIAPHHVLVALLTALLAWLTLLPVARLVIGSFTSSQVGEVGALTLANYARVYSDPLTYELFLNSVLFGVGSCLVAFTLGTALAWIIERTDTPGRQFFFAVSLVPLIVPGIVMTIAWLFLLSPQIGVINRIVMGVLGLQSAPFNIYTLGGMIWVEGLSMSPLVFLLMSAAMKSMDPSLEESASTSGAGAFQTLRRVTLPLMLPTILSVLLIIFVRVIEAFEVPAIIGLPSRIFVFTSRIYLALAKSPSDYGLASALSTSLIVISVLGIFLYRRLTSHNDRFATVSGKAFRPRQVALGRWRFLSLAFLIVYSLLIIVLPMAILLWISFNPFFVQPSLNALGRLTLRNYTEVLTFPNIINAARNSLILAGSTAIIAMLFAAVLSWISIRSRVPGRQALDVLGFLPIAVPGIVMGAALLSLYINFPIPIYGTLWVLFLAYVTRFLPYGLRASSGSLLQIKRELEEAAEMSGADWLTRFRYVLLPLLRPGLLAGGVYIFLVSIRELSSSSVLTGPNSTVLAVIILEFQEAGRWPLVAALSVLMVAAMVVLVAILQKLGGRVGIRH